MRILVDENIPFGREAFSTLGEVRTMAGRAVDAEAVRDIDLLMVRSITKVNRALLESSPIRFVATATIGEDHIDKAYLAEKGIGFSSAPGCNANSVGQYFAAAMLELAQALDLQLEDLKLGIVGVGNTGKRAEAKATALGMTCVLNDPPLARATGDARYRPLEEIYDCDIVTCHVPITKTGADATWHLVDEAFLGRMKPGSILLNMARGPVVDGQALRAALDAQHVRASVLDVWEGEPEVNIELLKRVFIGTPHIAGYSFDGKVDGTRQIYEAACKHLGVEPAWDAAPLLPAPECPEVRVSARDADPVYLAVNQVYDIMRDDADMRRLLSTPEAERGPFFDALRKNYPRRREFFNTRAVVEPPDAILENRLAGLGFSMD